MDLRFVLYELGRMLKSIDETVLLSSSKFGLALGVSQQTASRYLSSLEKKGFIKRVIRKRGQEVSLTKQGISVLEEMHKELGFLLKASKTLEMVGRVTIGLGEGAYYVRMYAEKIEKELGFRPYYGTLNVTVSEIPVNLSRFAFKSISPFVREGRTFGRIEIIKIKLSSGRKTVGCFLILPERTHHQKELEIISSENLRKKLGLKNGSSVKMAVNV